MNHALINFQKELPADLLLKKCKVLYLHRSPDFEAMIKERITLKGNTTKKHY